MRQPVVQIAQCLVCVLYHWSLIHGKLDFADFLVAAGYHNAHLSRPIDIFPRESHAHHFDFGCYSYNFLALQSAVSSPFQVFSPLPTHCPWGASVRG